MQRSAATSRECYWPVLGAGALGDELVAVIGQHPDLHRTLLQERGRDALDPVAHDGAGDRRRVHLV